MFTIGQRRCPCQVVIQGTSALRNLKYFKGNIGERPLFQEGTRSPADRFCVNQRHFANLNGSFPWPPTRTDGGIVRRSALAVFMLMTKSSTRNFRLDFVPCVSDCNVPEQIPYSTQRPVEGRQRDPRGDLQS